jgi:hypothetical protein
MLFHCYNIIRFRAAVPSQCSVMLSRSHKQGKVYTDTDTHKHKHVVCCTGEVCRDVSRHTQAQQRVGVRLCVCVCVCVRVCVRMCVFVCV